MPEWPYKPPRDPEAIEELSQAYFDSGYNIREMLRVLLKSDFFKSEDVWYERVKSPAELLAGVLKLTGEFGRPREEMIPTHMQSWFMGSTCSTRRRSRDGTGARSGSTRARWWSASTSRRSDWGTSESPGVDAMVNNVLSDGNGSLGPAELVERALDQLSLPRSPTRHAHR